MKTIHNRFGMLVCSTLVLGGIAGCGGISVVDMVPQVATSPTARIERTIYVAPVTGGGVISNKSSTLIAVDNEKFREAQVLAMRRSGLFKAVSDVPSDVELRTTIVSQYEHRDIGEELILNVRYEFFDSKSNRLILRDGYQTGTDTQWATTALAEISRNNLDAMLRNLPALWPGLANPAPEDKHVGPREAGIEWGSRVGLVVTEGSYTQRLVRDDKGEWIADEREREILARIYSAFKKELIDAGQRQLGLSLVDMRAGDLVYVETNKGITGVNLSATARKQGFDKLFDIVLTVDLDTRSQGASALAKVELRVRQASDGKILWERQSRPIAPGGTYRYTGRLEQLGIDAARRALLKFENLGAARGIETTSRWEQR